METAVYLKDLLYLDLLYFLNFRSFLSFFLALGMRVAWDTFPFAQSLLVLEFTFHFLLFYYIIYNVYLPMRPIKLIDFRFLDFEAL